MSLFKFNDFFTSKKIILHSQKDSAGVLPFCKTTKQFLLNLRSNAVSNPNVYSSWGGEIKEVETPKIAAIREFEEESGCPVTESSLLYLNTSLRDDGDWIKKYYLFLTIVEDVFDPLLCKESKGYKWISFEELYFMNENALHPEFYKTLNNIKSKLKYFLNI